LTAIYKQALPYLTVHINFQKEQPMDESRIIYGLQRRQLEAFNMLFESLYFKVQYYVEQITNDPSEAEDIAIHSFAKFWEQDLSRFHTIKKITNFIYNIAKNSAIDFLRKQKVIEVNQAAISYLTNQEAYVIERTNYKMEMLDFLNKEIEKLPAQTKTVLKLVYFENLTSREVAERLHISDGTVRNLCYQAIQKLRRKFSENELMILLLIVSICKN
jgi:RNA polymerase sigma factor (sigma-70 family)